MTLLCDVCYGHSHKGFSVVKVEGRSSRADKPKTNRFFRC